MPQLIDRTGRVYGRLRVVGRFECGPASKGQRTKWVCVCECGAEKIATGHELASGDTTSCGCFQRESTGDRHRRHGMTRTPTYNSWQAAKQRCHDPKAAKYPSYGGRGIKMCNRWRESFDAFLEDMGERPKGMTLDRIDQCKGYEPDNVRWATAQEQSINRGTTQLRRWRGGWMTTRQISEVEGVSFNSLRKYVRSYRTIQDAVEKAKASKRNFRAKP